jgi:hypothetical protein
MSTLMPAPSMIVVFSFSTTISFASPRSLGVACASPATSFATAIATLPARACRLLAP